MRPIDALTLYGLPVSECIPYPQEYFIPQNIIGACKPADYLDYQSRSCASIVSPAEPVDEEHAREGLTYAVRCGERCNRPELRLPISRAA